jgi:cobalt-zinc-cadmium efflux system protein
VNGWLRHPALHLVLALALGGVFLYASYDKILHPREFARIVYQYQTIGPSQTLGFAPANTLAVILPWVELVCGLCLVTGLWRREAAGLAGLMLVMFVLAVSSALWQGIDLKNCGCFKVSGGGRSAGELLVGDLALLAVAGLLAFVTPRPWAAPAVAEPSPAVRA